MTVRNGQKWSREETILAFDLYCRTSFGRISGTNPDIIELAKLLGRTPGSVALKMSNLAYYDPELKARNKKGMSHGSKLDSIIFNEFFQNLEELAYQSKLIKNKEFGQNADEQTVMTDLDTLPPGKYKEQMVKTRLGQYAFRLAVLNSYNKRCCITGLAVPKMLVASHIKPWADSDENTERTNPCNGLCLNAFHDKAFDQGLITIDKQYHIIISSQLKKADMDDATREWLKRYGGEKIFLPEKFSPGKEFIEYHNDVIFKP